MALIIYALLLLCLVQVVFIVGVLIDRLVGAPLSERVKVTGHKFVPAHLRHTGNAVMRVPDRWTLTVENSKGRGTIAIPQPMYESIADGEIVRVKGKRGCISGKWYLKKASKDDEPLQF